MDTLTEHAFGCSQKMDNDLVVIYCQDGFIAIDSTIDYLSSAVQQNQARMTLNYGSAPRDVQLGKLFISITNEDGTSLTVIKKSDLKPQNFKLDAATGPSASLSSGHFTPIYMVLLI